MQTFLPYADFVLSAKVLDYRRLGKQRVEARQILNTLEGKSSGWSTHPAVLMWQGFAPALGAYMDAMIFEWVARGYQNTMASYWTNGTPSLSELQLPPWFGDPALHASHRSNLLRKDATFYGRYGWTEPSDLPYVWPVRRSP
jgi:hypothetical protein